MAFHTYFAVSHISHVAVHGLDAFSYADNLQKRQICQPAEIRTIDKEIDRIYFDVTNPVVISDQQRNLVISGLGLNDVVLWNPWIEKAKKMADLPDDGYLYYVCVEHGVIKSPPEVAPGGHWEGAQEISVKPIQSKI
jgi:glucose-6-phosphate 1-epimerase